MSPSLCQESSNVGGSYPTTQQVHMARVRQAGSLDQRRLRNLLCPTQLGVCLQDVWVRKRLERIPLVVSVAQGGQHLVGEHLAGQSPRLCIRDQFPERRKIVAKCCNACALPTSPWPGTNVASAPLVTSVSRVAIQGCVDVLDEVWNHVAPEQVAGEHDLRIRNQHHRVAARMSGKTLVPESVQNQDTDSPLARRSWSAVGALR